MKKIILIMLLSFPILMLAQTKAKKPRTVEKTVFVYMVMEYKAEPTTIKSPKKSKEGVRDISSKKTNYVFTINNKRIETELIKISTTFIDEISALNSLGKMGWELVDVNNGKYYFRTERLR